MKKQKQITMAMEREQNAEPKKNNFAQKFREDIEVSIDRGDIWREPTIKIKNNKVRQLVIDLMNLTKSLRSESFELLVPELSQKELVARGTRMILDPLKKIDVENGFGSVWNEWTIKLAGEKIGLAERELMEVVSEKSERGQLLRMEQSLVATEMEEAAREKLTGLNLREIKSKLAMESWLLLLVEEVEKVVEDQVAIRDILTAFLEIVDFAPGQKLPFKQLRQKLVAARTGKEIKIVDLHCLAFLNSKDKGIEVVDTASDFTIENEEGKRMKISQRDILENVTIFKEIFDRNKICNQLVVLVVDNDRFVMPGQEERVMRFIESLPAEVKRLIKDDFVIVKASEILGDVPLMVRGVIREGTRKQMVEEELEKLKQRTLPLQMQTEEFAEEIAEKSLAMQTSLGQAISESFSQAIVLQKTKAHQQATELFNVGAAGTKEPAIVIAHWREREII